MAVERWTNEMVDQLAQSVDQLAESIKELREEAKAQREEFKAQREELKAQREESKELNIRFTAYQQASQWVVNLAFGLLATATLTTIITAVFRR